MKIVVDVPDEEYDSYALAITFGMGNTAIRRILNGTPLPEGAEILTKEAYSDLCLRASRIPCYLGSPCEYQNENIEIPQCDNNGDCEHCDWATCPKMEGAE